MTAHTAGTYNKYLKLISGLVQSFWGFAVHCTAFLTQNHGLP